MHDIEDCTRCGSKIIEPKRKPPERQRFWRHLESGEVECNDANLCSECHDDLHDFVFNSDVDRSDRADPVPLDRLAEDVERHIESLKSIIESLEEQK